jgi:hypothetical protein
LHRQLIAKKIAIGMTDFHYSNFLPNFGLAPTCICMKKSVALKIGILLCSISLATWFVAYRAGYFSPAPADPNSVPAVTQQDAPQADSMSVEAEESNLPESGRKHILYIKDGDTVYMSDEMMVLASSKSGKIFYPDSPKKEIPHNNAPYHTFTGGAVNEPVLEPTPATNDMPTSAGDDRFMNSSKSGDVFRPAPHTNIQISPSNGTPANQASDRPVMHKEPEGFISGRKPGNANAAKPQDSGHVDKIYFDDDFMGSSKSAPVFYPPAKIDTNKPKNPNRK